MVDQTGKYLNEESRFISIDGMEVHYRSEGSGPDLVLLHGTFASLHAFDDWTDHFKKSYRVTRLDLPGFGYTGAHPERDYTVNTYISFLRKFLIEINIEKCILAGNSLGGMLTWEFSLVYPSRVNKLILIDAVGFVDEFRLPQPFMLVRKSLLRAIMKLWTPKAMVKKQVKDVYYDYTRIENAKIDRYFDLFVGERNHIAFCDFAQQEIKDNSVELPKLEISTLILWGKQDKWIPVRIGRLFAKSIPNSELIIYDKCGHVPMEEIPKKTIKDVSIFLQDNR